MNTRALAAIVALVLAAALWRFERSAHRTEIELGARMSQMEEQMQVLKRDESNSEREQLKAENTRLLAENKGLRASLAELKANSSTVPVSTTGRSSTDSNGHDPLAFYRRNPELMKRYFPQLYKSEVQSAEKNEAIPSPPSE